MAGVSPDTYSVTFTRTGYETFTLTGVTVVQGQIANATTALNASLQRIGRTQARSTTGAFQPTQTTDQYNVGTQGIATTLGKTGATNESNLLASIPGASFDSSGYPVLRGGREYEEGFQYEGIDYTDAFTHQFVNSLILNGAQNFQVQPGAGDASVGNAGTGAINVVAKRGQHPAFGQFEGDLLAGRYQHQLHGEYGWASPNGRYSDYASAFGTWDGFHYGAGGSDALQIGQFFNGRANSWAHDVLNNFVYKFGRDNNQSLQFYYQNTQFDLHLGYGVQPGGLPYKSTDGFFLANARANYGLSNSQIQTIMPFTLGQQFLGDRIGSQGDRRNIANYNQPNETWKLQYSNNLDATTFITVKAYRVNAVVLFDFPYDATNTVFFGDFVANQGGFHNAFALDGTKQLGSKNLLGFGGKYDFLRPVYSQPGATTAMSNFAGFGNGLEAADFFASNNCPYGPSTVSPIYNPLTSTCGYITQFMPARTLTCTPNPGVVCGTPGLGVQLPYSDESTHVTRSDWALYVKDTYSPTDRLKLDLGLRLDGANWHMPTCNIQWCAPTSFTADPITQVPTSFAFNYDADTRTPRVLQPRAAIAWQATKNDSFRFSYGRSVNFAALAQVDLTGSDTAYGAFAGIPSFDVNTGTTAQFCSVASVIGGPLGSFKAPCASYAQQLNWENQSVTLGIPITPLKPVTFNNFDFSYSHLFPHQVSVKVTPFYNKSYNQIASVAQQLVKNGVPVVDINGNPVLGPSFNSNLGKSQIMGTEFLLTKEAAYGLSGSLSLTYQNEFSNVVPTSPSEDFFPSIPAASLQLGNLYRVGFLSPFVGALSIQERTRTGWRINPVVFYNHGYPISPGLITANFVNGKPFNLPNTNVTNSAQLNAAAGADRYVDPRNPGTMFAPNIDATRGTPDSNAAGGILSAARFTPVQITFEYTSPRNPRSTFGALMLNVFNQLNGQPGLSTRYQPVATGIAGPYSGYSSSANQVQPTFFGITNNYPFRRGNMPYTITPNAIPRTVQFYYQLNI